VEWRAVAYNVFLQNRDERCLVRESTVGLHYRHPSGWFVVVQASRRSPEFRSAGPVYGHRFRSITAGAMF
jgi:hypothetical protein